MSYRERPSRLAGAVVWTRPAGGGGDPVRVLPDGCMDLIWVGGTVLIAGPDTRFQLTAGAAPGGALVGLRFAPGFGPRVIGAPACEFTDLRVPLADVWPAGDLQALIERLATVADPGQVLEDLALQLSRRRDNGSGLVDEVVARVRGGETVTAVADAVGLSSRQLHRRCLDVFGYGAKTLGRILRMGHALELARAGVPFAVTSAQAGYADQAHLARDVKALAGVTLGQLVAPVGRAANRSTELPSGSWTAA